MTSTLEQPAPVARIDGNVDPSTGNLDVPGDLFVAGNIADLHEVNCAGNAQIAGAIEAAKVTIGGNLSAHGGISGKGKGRCFVSGKTSARYIANATIEVEGDLLVQTEITASTIICGANAKIEEGPIVGGIATILGSLHCQSLGSEAGTPTIVEIGVDEFLRRLAKTSVPKIERLRKKSLDIRNAAAPLLKIQKSLSNKQKEQVTEMLFEADTFDSEADELQDALKARLRMSQPDPALSVADILHPGVIVRFPDVQVQITTALRGPIRLVSRSAAGQRHVSAIEGSNQAGYPLPSRPWQDPHLLAVARLFNGSTV